MGAGWAQRDAEGMLTTGEPKGAPGSGMCSVLLLIKIEVIAVQQLRFLPKQKSNKNLLHSLSPVVGIM